MEKAVLIKKLKNKISSKEEKYKNYYKKNYHTYQFLKSIADTQHLKPCKGKLRQYQLDLLDFAKDWFNKFENLNTDYFLISGNLLGAYRNQGFIPWDDDIDIGMLRQDFDKTIEYLKNNFKEVDVSKIFYSKRNRSEVISDFIEKNPNQTAFAIFPTHLQILHGQNMENLMTLDIHPYDYYSDDYSEEEIKKDIALIKHKKTEIDNFKKLNEYLKDLRLNNKKIVKKSNKIYYGYDNYDITFLPFSSWYEDFDINPTKKTPFEDAQLKIPNNPIKSLLINYGKNYMDMPKEITLNSHIDYRKDCNTLKTSINKDVILKKLERKFRFSKEKIYKELYKKTKPLAELMLQIVDIKTVKPCQEKKLRKLQLDCVEFAKKITDFFDFHNLEYFITSGTLLGSVRHSGFVPWDDDFDVGMMRKDYEKLKSILKKNFKAIDLSKVLNSKGNNIQTIDNALKNSNGEIIYLIGPKYIQIYQGESFKNCRLIDVFPHEYYKNSYTLEDHKQYMLELKKELASLDCRQEMVEYLDFKRKNNPNIEEKSENIYYGIDSLGSYIVNPTAPMSQDMIFPRKKVKFEGYEFWAPNDPDGYIKVQYPDYWNFPTNFIIAPLLEIKTKQKF